MLYAGNCLLGLLYLCVIKRSLRIRAYIQKDKSPHFYLKVKDEIWHFKLVKDTKPYPFDYIWFKGRFEKLPKSKYPEKEKQLD